MASRGQIAGDDPTVLLLSAPWPNHRSPSIQIAVLKAYLEANGVAAQADHFFLRVAAWLGFSNYAKAWAPILEDAEALYGALLFPSQIATVLALPSLAEKKLVVEVDGEELIIPSRRFFRAFAEMHERELDRFDFRSIKLVGLTLNFGQTLASAYIAARIKERAPHVRVVIGGAEATGQLGTSLLKVFPQFDYACSGEGEHSLLRLARALETGEWNEVPDSIATSPGDCPTLAPEVTGIGDLPTPDFDDYFNLIDELGLNPADVCEHIPFETSRGCYYSCSFCSLNLQWRGYRQASPKSIDSKMATLRKKHGRLSFFFVDNITPVAVSEIADAVAEQGVDYKLFYEARVNLDRRTWKSLANAGLRHTQLGIEALSDDLLKIYNKKSTVLHNLQALKHCYEFGIAVSGNIILGHPLARAEHVQQSLENFEFFTAFPPSLSVSHYALLVGSPDFRSGLRGVSVTGNYNGYSRAYPPDVLEVIDLPRKSFRVDRPDAVPDFEALVRSIEHWEKVYSRHQARFGGREPILTMQDGGDFLRIEDWRSGERVTFDLDERERAVYKAMSVTRRLEEVARLTSIDLDWVEGVVRAFSKERLAYSKGGRGLALALRKRGAPA